MKNIELCTVSIMMTLALVLDFPFASSIIIIDRRQTLQRLVFASATAAYPHPSSAFTEETTAANLDFIDWNAPKSRGLNTERMCDGINDSIRETAWLVSGVGSPSYFSDDFLYHSDESGTNVRIKGYEAYCRWVSKRYSNEQTKQPQCDLICCSVTAKSTITALWRLGYTGYSDKKRSKVYVSTFTTSDQDGLVIYQYDKVLIAKDAPSGDELRAKCNWYSCMPESLI